MRQIHKSDGAFQRFVNISLLGFFVRHSQEWSRPKRQLKGGSGGGGRAATAHRGVHAHTHTHTHRHARHAGARTFSHAAHTHTHIEEKKKETRTFFGAFGQRSGRRRRGSHTASSLSLAPKNSQRIALRPCSQKKLVGAALLILKSSTSLQAHKEKCDS